VLKAAGLVEQSQNALQRKIKEFGDEETWVKRWVAAGRLQDDDIAAIERYFERIINAWQDEVFDALEQEAAGKGLTPKPPTGPLDGERWSQDAREQELIPKLADDPKQAPNRWRRQVLIGILQDSDVKDLVPLANVRQLFSHRYTESDDEAKGRLVWKRMDELDKLVPVIAGRIGTALDKFWPST
jgi:hypothetical protein